MTTVSGCAQAVSVDMPGNMSFGIWNFHNKGLCADEAHHQLVKTTLCKWWD